MEALRNDPYPDPSAELVAALALGLATSWRDPEEQIAELREAADAAQAAAARAYLLELRTPDPQATQRALALLDVTFPPSPPLTRPTIVPAPTGDAGAARPAVGA